MLDNKDEQWYNLWFCTENNRQKVHSDCSRYGGEAILWPSKYVTSDKIAEIATSGLLMCGEQLFLIVTKLEFEHLYDQTPWLMKTDVKCVYVYI